MAKKVLEQEDFEQVAPQEAPKIPHWGDPDWGDYVLTLFTENEKVEGLPTCNGLRRVFFNLFDVVSSERDLFIPEQGISIGWRVRFVPRKVLTLNETIPTITISATASCSLENTKHPFSKYLVATADTRAEARCYRKALLLNCIAAEEIPDGMEEVPQGEMSEALSKMILNMCKMNKISISDLLRVHKKEIADKGHDVLVFEYLTKAEAAKVMNILNAYQSNSGVSIPEEIKVKE
jgi:hypothetical protein